jgi:hypothetical protein
MEFRKLNVTTNSDIHLFLIIDEILHIVVGNETYWFLNDVSQYHQISKALKDWYNIVFVINQGAFVWIVMPFDVKNCPPTYQWTINKTFCLYENSFMKIFLSDFIVFRNMDMHFDKLQLCFLKHWEDGISLDWGNCIYIVSFGLIIGLIIFKEWQFLASKRI